MNNEKSNTTTNLFDGKGNNNRNYKNVNNKHNDNKGNNNN